MCRCVCRFSGNSVASGSRLPPHARVACVCVCAFRMSASGASGRPLRAGVAGARTRSYSRLLRLGRWARRVFLRRFGHCAIFVSMLQCCLSVGGPAFAIPAAYGATRAISASSAAGHGSDCRPWTACTVGSAVGFLCGAWWGAVAAACVGLCPWWFLRPPLTAVSWKPVVDALEAALKASVFQVHG